MPFLDLPRILTPPPAELVHLPKLELEHTITLCLLEASADPDAYGLDEPVVTEFCLPCIGWIVSLPLLIVACCRGLDEVLSWLLVAGYLESMEYHSVDKRLTYLMMMVLVRHTKEYDMMLHMEKSGMLKLVVEIEPIRVRLSRPIRLGVLPARIWTRPHGEVSLWPLVLFLCVARAQEGWVGDGTTTSSSSNSQNVAFVYADNTSSTNDVNDDDLEEMDLKWHVAMISMRIKKFHKRTGRKLQFDTRDTVEFDKTKVECFNCHKMGHFASDCRAKWNQDSRRRDEAVDWSGHVKEDTQNFAMMAYSSSNSGSEMRLLNTQMSANDKFGLGYGDYRYGSILCYENEVLQSVFMNKEFDLENIPVNDRYIEGTHTVPPPMTGNYMPSGPDVEIDFTKFTYGPKQTSVNESNAKTSENTSSDSESSVEPSTSVPEPVVNESKVVSEPKAVSKPNVWIDAPIIEKYELDSDDDTMSNVKENIEKPSFHFTDSIKHVKSPRENVKETGTPNHYLKIEKQDRHCHNRNGLENGKKVALTKSKEKGTGQQDDPYKALKDKGIVDSGCSRHMTGNKAHLADYCEFKGDSVAFGGSNGRITGNGKIKAGRLDFEDVYYVEELKHYNHFSVSQMCDKKNTVLFIDTDCLVLSPNFKLPNENQVLLKIPRQHNMSDNGIEFKNHDLIEFCGLKGIKREYSNAKIPQQNRVAETKNKTLIEAARTMLADLFLPTTFWAEAINTACYVLNREIDLHDEHFVLPVLSAYLTSVKSSRDKIGKNENTPISVVGPSRPLNDDEPSYPNDPSMPHLKDIYASPCAGIFTNSSYDDEGVVTDFNNLEMTVNVSPTPTTRIHTIYPKTKIIRDPLSTVQTRSKVHKNSEAHALVYYIQKQQRNNHKDLQHYLPFRKKAIGTKWVYRNKKDKRGVVVRNKSRLVVQGHRQEEGIDYDEVFSHVARIEAIRIFLAFASYMGFIVYQMDVKCAFLYGTLDEEVYVTQPPGFVDPKFPNKVYKVVKAHMDYIKLLELGMLLCPHCWREVDIEEELLTRLYLSSKTKRISCYVKTASTLIETQKPLVKHEEAVDVDVYLYRSMIGSLMYLTASRPDIMFAVCACSRFQVTPKTLHLQAMKRIFRCLKGQPKLDLWRLISWQCKKQTIVATSAINAEYVVAVHCCGQVLWIQNQLLDYGFNLMNIKIYIDNESIICIVKNPIFHSKTKHVEIRHHFIRDAYEKKLIYVFKIHTDDKVVDLLTKAFDVSSKELASPKQTALGKDESNPLIVDSLLKTIWSSMHHVIAMKHWLLQSKRSVRYALKASPTIRTSCIKQFWSTSKVKTVNDEVRFQALIDGKKVTIKESSIRRTLRLDDEEGTSCLANDDIFTGLANMGYEKIALVLKPPPRVNLATLWHQQSSILPQTRSLTSPAAEEVGQAQDDVSIPTEPPTSKPYKKHKSKKQQPIAPKVPSHAPSPEHQLPSPSNDPIPDADKDNLTLQELMNLCIRLSNKVLDLKSEVIDIKSSFTDKIQKLEDRVDQLEEENRALKEKSFKTTQVDTVVPVENMEKSFKQGRMIVDMDEYVVTTAQCTNTAVQVPKASVPRRRRGVVIQDPEETTGSVIVHTEVQPKDKGKGILIEEPKPLKCQAQIKQDEDFARQLEAELNANINWNDVVEQVKKSKRQNNKVIRYQALKRKPLNEAQERKNIMIYLKNMAGFKMDFFKGMTYNEIRPIFEKHYNSIQAFLEKVEEEVTVQEEGNKDKIVANDDDDVFTEATPLASKVPVVDYQIHHKNNKPYYKIIRADGTHKLFLSFITLLKNFDKEDLEALWKLVKERIKTTYPKNFSDYFLLNILKIMFEKPDIKANMILLVEKKYPLTHFTLQQMLDNVRLEVKEESEMSLVLLRLVRRQLNKGYVPE
nr:hypothetical protein [Tanacetum cinerariifolium]